MLDVIQFKVSRSVSFLYVLPDLPSTLSNLSEAHPHSLPVSKGNPANNVGTAMPALVTPKPRVPPSAVLMFESALNKHLKSKRIAV